MARQRCVLVVDDDEQIRDLVDFALTDRGCMVVGAPDGSVALHVIEQQTPDLILLDMRMPVMDGWEFARVYRQKPGPHAPIIVITAAVDATERAQQVGADGVLPKPFPLTDLYAAVGPCHAPIT